MDNLWLDMHILSCHVKWCKVGQILLRYAKMPLSLPDLEIVLAAPLDGIVKCVGFHGRVVF